MTMNKNSIIHPHSINVTGCGIKHHLRQKYTTDPRLRFSFSMTNSGLESLVGDHQNAERHRTTSCDQPGEKSIRLHYLVTGGCSIEAWSDGVWEQYGPKFVGHAYKEMEDKIAELLAADPTLDREPDNDWILTGQIPPLDHFE